MRRKYHFPTTTPPAGEVLTGPADWPGVRAACAREAWQAAYGHARGCPEAAAHIEARKAEALAALTAVWRARQGGGAR